MRQSTLVGHYQIREHVVFPYVLWKGLFTSSQIDDIIKILEPLPFEEAEVGATEEVSRLDIAHRRSHLKWIREFTDDNSRAIDEHAWIFQRIRAEATAINDQSYEFALAGNLAIQYAEYRASDKGMYGPHMDKHYRTNVSAQGGHRKLSMSILLSEPGVDFQGGRLLFTLDAVNWEPMEGLIKGRAVAFESTTIHQVEPVTEGIRKVLIIWFLGPKAH